MYIFIKAATNFLSTEKRSCGYPLILQISANGIKILIPYCLFFYIETDVSFMWSLNIIQSVLQIQM